jgi:hypothetical protein
LQLTAEFSKGCKESRLVKDDEESMKPEVQQDECGALACSQIRFEVVYIEL